jgi:hypothetical protein
MVGVVLLAMVSVLLYQWWQTEAQRERANAYGQVAAQVAVGLRGYIASVQQSAAAGTFTGAGPYTGVDWLKSPSCGGLASNPPAGFVPCAFTGGALGASYSTTITYTPATKTVETRTSFVVPIDVGGVAGLASVAAQTARAARAQQALPANGTFYTVFANTPVNATAQTPPGSIAAADRGRVLVIASNAPSQDLWLRTDGTNQMLADLNVGGHSVANAKDGTFSGGLEAMNGLLHGNLQVNGAATVNGNLTTVSNLQVTGAANVNQNLTVNGSSTVNGDSRTNGYNSVGGDLWVDSNSHLQGAVTQGNYSGANNIVLQNGVVAANDVSLGSVGRYASQGFYNWQTLVLNSPTNISKPNCSAVAGGTSTPRIIAVLQGTGSVPDTAYGGSAPLTTAQVAVNDMGTYWQLVPTVNGVQYQMTTSSGGGGTTVNFNKTARTGSGLVVTYLTQCG